MRSTCWQFLNLAKTNQLVFNSDDEVILHTANTSPMNDEVMVSTEIPNVNSFTQREHFKLKCLRTYKHTQKKRACVNLFENICYFSTNILAVISVTFCNSIIFMQGRESKSSVFLSKCIAIFSEIHDKPVAPAPNLQ